MSKVRRTFRFVDDAFGERYTFSEVSVAAEALRAAETLLSAVQRVRRENRGPSVYETFSQRQRTPCPSCKHMVFAGDVRAVSLSDGSSVKLYVHRNDIDTRQAVRQVCRVAG